MNLAFEGDTAHECSTPCGINGILTCGRCPTPAPAGVLNALRHQWNPHLMSSTRVFVTRCTQRLAASMESSLALRVKTRYAHIVLNALRHQWNPHARCPTFPAPSPAVLNALRHQWNPHVSVIGAFVRACLCSTPCGINGILTGTVTLSVQWIVMCSTPCGINGILTHPAQHILGGGVVLNALRHQWNPH